MSEIHEPNYAGARTPPRPSYLLPVQLNVSVPYAYREHLQQVAKRRNISLAECVRLALREVHPHPLSFPDPPKPEKPKMFVQVQDDPDDLL